MRDTPHRLMAIAEDRAEMADARVAELMARVERLEQALREIPNAIPTNWLDSLLSGPDAVVRGLRYDSRDIELLLNALRERIVSIARAALNDKEKQ